MAIDMLISKLERRFSLHELMNALGIVWLYYWLVLGWKATLPIPMAVLKAQTTTSTRMLALMEGLSVPMAGRPLTCG